MSLYYRPPYIIDGNYMYPNVMYETRRPVPYYGSTRMHKQPGLRELPFNKIRDDGIPYSLDKPVWTGSRTYSPIVSNFVNIETSIKKILKVVFYGTSEEYDKTIEMEVGKRYGITYVTEIGLRSCEGTLREIANSIPDDCTRYVGEYNAVTQNAYIGMDCSVAGNSDKKMIYVATIRDIEELGEDENYESFITDDERLTDTQKLLKAIGLLRELKQLEITDSESISAAIDEVDGKINNIDATTVRTEEAVNTIIGKLETMNEKIIEMLSKQDATKEDTSTIIKISSCIKDMQYELWRRIESSDSSIIELVQIINTNLGQMSVDLSKLKMQSDEILSIIDDTEEYLESEFSYIVLNDDGTESDKKIDDEF